MNHLDDPMSSASSHGLKRHLGFLALLSYGLGDILGAGIYALMGKVAGVAGAHAWLGFCVSLLAAAITALSYSELVTRFPRSGGEAYYCEQAFRLPLISSVVGFLVFCAGTLSLSAIAVAFAGYLRSWLPALPGGVASAGFIAVLGLVNFRGIRESSIANIVCTVVEAGGLLLVIVVGGRYLLQDGQAASPSPSSSLGTVDWSGVMQGAALAFFAFIGFQDMVNVAEEVKEPERNFPRAILSALAVAGAVYVVIALLATAIVDPRVLGQSNAPLVEVVRTAAGGGVGAVFPVIALFAVANTGLLNFVMASRLLYGMAWQGLLPGALTRVHARRRTPHVAILTVLAAALALALSGTLSYLAGSTSALLLVVFLVVNLALARVKWRSRGDADDAQGVFRIPLAVPLVGAAVIVAVMGFSETRVLLTASVLIAVGAALHGVGRLVGRRRDT